MVDMVTTRKYTLVNIVYCSLVQSGEDCKQNNDVCQPCVYCERLKFGLAQGVP